MKKIGLGLFFLISLFLVKSYLYTTQVADGLVSEDIEKDFKSYYTKIQGTQKIQLAELEQMEILSETSRRRVLWDKLELPPVVVAVAVPVTYTYYVDLKKPWVFNQNENTIEVVAPLIEFNKPAPDISAMDIQVKKSSLFTDEKQVSDRIISQLTGFLNQRAQENKDLIREQARKELSGLVTTWLLQNSFYSQKVEIFFEDEQQNQETRPSGDHY